MEERKTRLNVPGGGEVSAVITLPRSAKLQGSAVVAHGQFNDMDNPLITYFAWGLAGRGYSSIRFNFPYREKGEDNPDSTDILMAAYRKARDEINNRSDCSTYLAGKSLGARTASLVAKEDGAPGLVFLGYPLHSPGEKPVKYEHLIEIESPMLFFAGSEDPLCQSENLHWVMEQRTAPSSIQIISKGDHSFKLPDDDDRPQDIIYQEIASVTADWLDEYGH